MVDLLAEGVQLLLADPALQETVELACKRLEDIRNSYTLYRDLVIVDLNGTVIAKGTADELKSSVTDKVDDLKSKASSS